MEIRKLGTTDLHVSRVAIGGLYTSSLAGGVAETSRMLETAHELGINYSDTAPAYADSELILGEALQGTDKTFIVSTKFGRPDPFDPLDIHSLRDSFDESLRVLGRDSIDLMMIHEPDRPQQYPWFTNYDPLEGPVIDFLDELKSEGKIKATGIAGTTLQEMTHLVASGRFDVLLTAFNYNILFRESLAELIPLAKQQGMGIISGSAYAQGSISKSYREEVEARPNWMSKPRQQQLLKLYDFVDELDIELPELCLRFVLSQPLIDTVLVGAKSSDHLRQSAAYEAAGPLPQEIIDRLDEIAAMLPYRPYEEPMIMPLGKNYYGPGIANMGSAIQVGKLKET
ncbi:MAG: aldo/keto reductase [Pirellulales bacterium]